jgi:hypothetical protein
MTTSPVLLILELHGPDAGLSRSLSSIGRMPALGTRTLPNASRKLRAAHLHTSPSSVSPRCDRRKNPIQTP